MTGKASRATIYTIAEQAGVSISTVSLAINHPHRVSDETRRRIVGIARSLGYRPEGAYRARTGARPVAVAVAAPFTSYASYARRLTGILDRLRDTGIDVMVYDLPSAAAATAPLLDALPIRAGIDGIIVMGVPLSREGGTRLADWGPPLVTLDARDQLNPAVLIDDRHGGRLVGEHLAALGHERVVFVHEPQLSFDYVSAGMLRLDGFRAALEGAGVTRDVEAIEVAAGVDGPALADLISGSGATAVFATHDELAGRVRRAALGAGMSVPGDLSVVGFDDGPLAEAVGLTTVRQPFEESGRAAAELLLGLMTGAPSRVTSVGLGVELVVRESSGPVGIASQSIEPYSGLPSRE